MGRYDKYKDENEARKARDEEIKKHQEEWRRSYSAGDTAGMEKAHAEQAANIAEFDDYFHGKSTYDPQKGTWSLSDGERTTGAGIAGNSFLEPYYDRSRARGAKEYSDAYEAYKNNAFSYDPLKDPDYALYKEAYEKAGREAFDDAMARSAARTGGAASSYAVTAGAMAYNDYMSRLSDKLPELRELAYEKYSDEQNRYLKRMSLALKEMTDDEAAYDKNRSAYLEQKATRKEEDAELASAMVKAQTGGFSALSDSDIRALYRAGSYYNPESDRIVASDGKEYALPEQNENDNSDGSVAAILLKFRYKGTGMAALSNSDIEKLINAGYVFNGTSWIAPDGTATEPVIKKTGSGSGSKKSSASSSGTAKNKEKNKSEAAAENTAGAANEKSGSRIRKKTIEPNRWRPGKNIL